MAVNNNSGLINQICTASGLSGKTLEELKARLVKMSEAELQAELTKALSGNNFYEDMGLKVERTITQKVSKEQEEQLKSALTARLNAVSTNVKKAEDSNGFLGKAWSWTKNTFNFGDSSEKVREQQKADLKALQSGNIKEAFKQITGLDYTVENVNKFLNNDVQTKSETALNGYTEGQDMASDVIADIFSGIATVGIYTAAVAAAPFSGGASIAVGIAAATASSAAIKTGLKYADAKSGGREYTADNLKKDMATGSVSGLLAPVTGGLGGAVGKTVAVKTLGIQAVKQVGKEVAEEAVEQTAKGFVKTALTNPYGYEYVGGNILKRASAYSAEMITDGAVSGFFDSAFRTAYDGGSLEEVGKSAVMGGATGSIGAWTFGGGIKVFGRGIQKAFGKNNVHIDANQNMIRTDVINDLLSKKVDIDYAAAVLRDVDDLDNVLKVTELNLSPKNKVEFERIKKQLIEKVNKNIADHGSIVLQTEIPTERFTVDSKTGIRYAKATRDDIVLAHAVQNDSAVESLTYLINTTRKYDENNYLSLSLVNKNSNFFGDGCDDKLCQEYGIIPKVKNKNVTSAGFGQVSEYKKDFNTFIRHSSLTESNSDHVYLKTCLLNKLKENGYDLSNTDYIQLFNLLKNKEYFSEITDDIEISGNIIKAETLKEILEEVHVNLSSSVMFGTPSNNEVTAIIDGIKAVYARVDNIDDVKPEVLALAKDNDLDIVLLGKPTKFEITDPKYFEELKNLELLFKNKEINSVEFQQKKRILKNKYEAIEKESLRAHTSIEKNLIVDEITYHKFLTKEFITADDIKPLFPTKKIKESYFTKEVEKIINNIPEEIKNKPDFKAIDYSLLIDDKEFETIAILLNMHKTKHLKNWLKKPDGDELENLQKLAMFARVIDFTHQHRDFLNFDKNQWDIVAEGVLKDSKNYITSILQYKYDSKDINLSLDRDLNTCSEDIQNLEAYLKLFTVKNDFVVYRGEGGYGILGTSNNKNLHHIVEQFTTQIIAGSKTDKEINDFIFTNLLGQNLHQKRFLSTTMTKEALETHDGVICWEELTVKKGSHGSFIESYCVERSKEAEFLVQSGCNILIKSARFDNGKWFLKGIIN